MASLVYTGFISPGRQTLTGSWQKGRVDIFAAYPTDGVPRVQLQVENVRYEKYVDPAYVWSWNLYLDVVNLGQNGVAYELYLASP